WIIPRLMQWHVRTGDNVLKIDRAMLVPSGDDLVVFGQVRIGILWPIERDRSDPQGSPAALFQNANPLMRMAWGLFLWPCHRFWWDSEYFPHILCLLLHSKYTAI